MNKNLIPLTMKIPDAVKFSGISRASLYRLASDGRIVFRKFGKATLVDVKSLSLFLEALPIADLNSA